MLKIVIILLCFFVNLLAQIPTIKYDSGVFDKIFFAGNKDDKLVELIRENETFENWTELIGIRSQYMPKINNEPLGYAKAMSELAKKINKHTNPTIHTNNNKTEAILYYSLWGEEMKFMEFNVWRFKKSKDGNAIESIQFVFRIPTTEIGVNTLKNSRDKWIERAFSFDMENAEKILQGWSDAASK